MEPKAMAAVGRSEAGHDRQRGLEASAGGMEFCNKRLLNGTKPICIENKGTLEEQTQFVRVSN
jgi:hypothetical protein